MTSGSQFPIGETRATTTARSNSYHAREGGDIELEPEYLIRGERSWAAASNPNVSSLKRCGLPGLGLIFSFPFSGLVVPVTAAVTS